MKKFLLSLLTLILIMSSTVFAAPKVELVVDDGVNLFNPTLIESLSDRLRVRLTDSLDVLDTTSDLTVDPTIDPTVDPTIDPTVDPMIDSTIVPTAEYRIEVRVLSMGVGKLVNSGIGTSISLGGTLSSIFVTPLSGSMLGSLGWVHATKPIFAVSAHVRVTRLLDGVVVYEANRLGRSNIAKKDERPPQRVIEDALDDAADTIARPLIKDSERSKPRVFR